MTNSSTTTKEKANGISPIWCFFALTFAISWLIWLPGVLLATGLISWVVSEPFATTLYTALNIAGGFGPTIAGLYLHYREGGKDGISRVLRSAVDFRRVKQHWWLAIFLLVPLIQGGALLLGILTGTLVPELLLLQQPYVIPVYFIVALLPFSNAIREEFGWRGYAIDRLQIRWNALATSMVIGLAWGIWHLPLWTFPLGAEVFSRTPLWVYILNTVMISIIMTWVYNNASKSMLSAIFLHAVLNTSGAIFPFAQTDFGVYFNLALQIVAVLLIVAVYGYKSLVKEDDALAQIARNKE
ncbi:MAG: CPBP family intramembrane metalloprotease [Candidatus Thorarchaeota archaeon]|nr:CPBP family intramembrane metalloprotease [Candidatus Thorarchaeota archaeon]